MKKIFSIILITILCACSSDDYITGIRAEEPIPPDPNKELNEFIKNSADFKTLVSKCETGLKSQYMVGTLIEETTNYPNYEGFPVKLYEYYTSADSQTGAKKKGRVYLLNPSAEKLATWIASAVWIAKGKLDMDIMTKTLNNIIGQSGAQFPVCGIVYEDMGSTTKPGQHPYLFKDGVTVYAADQSKWATENSKFPSNMSCTDEQLEYDTHITNDQLKTYTGTYARICSTTRENYIANGGKVDVGTSDSSATKKVIWLDVVRDLYKKAWNSNENELITAWVKGNC